MLMNIVSSLVLFVALGKARAVKDDSYYNANSGNPNVDLKMYWKDAENVMQDLSKFSALFVEFHTCVWSWMKYADTDDDIDENDYWYMGSVPPMGANVAFSLYGALKGQTFKGCSESTFINSFYTMNGFNDFATSMYYTGRSGFSGYTGNQDDDSYISAQCQSGYGVGCDSSGGFAMYQYSGSECDPQNIVAVSDDFSSLNSAMEEAQCVKIYDRNSYSGYSEGTALELLEYSTACNYMNFQSPDGNCPDPYGKISFYISNYNKGIKIKREDPFKAYDHQMEEAKKKTRTGVGLFGVAIAIAIANWLLPNTPRPKKRLRCFKKEDLFGDEATIPDGCTIDPYMLTKKDGTPMTREDVNDLLERSCGSGRDCTDEDLLGIRSEVEKAVFGNSKLQSQRSGGDAVAALSNVVVVGPPSPTSSIQQQDDTSEPTKSIGTEEDIYTDTENSIEAPEDEVQVDQQEPSEKSEGKIDALPTTASEAPKDGSLITEQLGTEHPEDESDVSLLSVPETPDAGINLVQHTKSGHSEDGVDDSIHELPEDTPPTEAGEVLEPPRLPSLTHSDELIDGQEESRDNSETVSRGLVVPSSDEEEQGVSVHSSAVEKQDVSEQLSEEEEQEEQDALVQSSVSGEQDASDQSSEEEEQEERDVSVQSSKSEEHDVSVQSSEVEGQVERNLSMPSLKSEQHDVWIQRSEGEAQDEHDESLQSSEEEEPGVAGESLESEEHSLPAHSSDEIEEGISETLLEREEHDIAETTVTITPEVLADRLLKAKSEAAEDAAEDLASPSAVPLDDHLSFSSPSYQGEDTAEEEGTVDISGEEQSSEAVTSRISPEEMAARILRNT